MQRYPVAIKGREGVFLKDDFSVPEIHFKYLSINHFPIVGKIPTKTPLRNKRDVDPQIMMSNHFNGFSLDDSYGLPVPNQEASYKSLAKYAKPIVGLSDQVVIDFNMAWSWTFRHFSPFMSNSVILSVDDAFARFDWSTSSGKLFNFYGSSKREVIEKFPEFREWVERDWDELMSETWTTVANNSLKEEIRPKSKIDDNSIRTFTSMAMDTTCHGTRLFADMNEKFYTTYLQHSSAVGLSPYGGDWDRLFRYLSRFSYGFALDQSQYDSSLRCYMMWECARLRWKLFAIEFRTPENLLRLLHYYRNLINTLISTLHGVLVLKKGGNPSGSVNTITDNTLILYSLLAFAWIQIMRTHSEFFSYEMFEAHTSKALVGDDNTFTVSDVCIPYFNARSIIAAWSALGITTTTDSLEPRPVKELDFLSAHFLERDGIMLPFYDRRKMQKSLLYIKKKNMSPPCTLERVCGLLSIGWCDEVFRHQCRKHISFLLMTYGSVLSNDPEWCRALTQIKTDDEYGILFTGYIPFSWQQSFVQETQERFIKPEIKTIEQMSVAKVHRADQFIKKNFLDKGLMTPGGWAWVRQALDPFHDEVVDPVGFPDGLNGSTTVTCIKLTNNIVSNQGAVANWDCHISTLPWMYNTPMDPNSLYTPAANNPGTLPVSPVTGAAFNRGTVNVDGYAVGAAIGFQGWTQANTILTQQINPIAFPSDARVVGIALEVYNTTAPLYRQGTIMPYRLPHESNAVSTYNLTNTATPPATLACAASAFEMQPLPNSGAGIMALQGSLQWNAEEGAYVVVPMYSNQNPMTAAEYVGNYFYDANTGTFGRYWAVGVIPTTTIPALFSFPLQQNIPYHTCGLYLQGLSPQTTLTLVTHIYVERMPNPYITTEQDFCRLAKKAQDFDPMALHIYSEAVRRLPVACKVKDNALGDWFLDTVSEIASLAAPALSMVFPEFAPFIMGGSKLIGAGAKSFKTYRKETKKLKKAKKQVKKENGISVPNASGQLVTLNNKPMRLPQGPKEYIEVKSGMTPGKFIGPRRQGLASNFRGPVQQNQRRVRRR